LQHLECFALKTVEGVVDVRAQSLYSRHVVSFLRQAGQVFHLVVDVFVLVRLSHVIGQLGKEGYILAFP